MTHTTDITETIESTETFHTTETKETNEMIKTAQLAEMAIVYGNRYRSNYSEVDKGLCDAESKFYKGEYKSALDISIKATSIVDENIYRKLTGVYEK